MSRGEIDGRGARGAVAIAADFHAAIVYLRASGRPDLKFVAEVISACLKAAPFAAAADFPSTWQTELAAHRRNLLLAEIAKTVGRGLTGRKLAANVEREIRRYARAGFDRDARAARRPSDARGQIYDFLIESGGEALSDDRIRKILKHIGGLSPGRSDNPVIVPPS